MAHHAQYLTGAITALTHSKNFVARLNPGRAFWTEAVYLPTNRDPQVTKVLCPFFVQKVDGLRPVRKTICSCRDHPKTRQQGEINGKQCEWSKRATLAVGLDKTEEELGREGRRYFVPCDWLPANPAAGSRIERDA